MRSNQITPDDFVFDPLQNSFRYLRSTILYNNTPTEIQSMLDLSTVSTPIAGGGTLYSSEFIVPSGTNNDYLYLIWDFRNSYPIDLCSPKGTVAAACCGCNDCLGPCVSVKWTNPSYTNSSNVYFPAGLCDEEGSVTVVLDPLEVYEACFTYSTFGGGLNFEVQTGTAIVEITDCSC